MNKLNCKVEAVDGMAQFAWRSASRSVKSRFACSLSFIFFAGCTAVIAASQEPLDPDGALYVLAEHSLATVKVDFDEQAAVTKHGFEMPMPKIYALVADKFPNRPDLFADKGAGGVEGVRVVRLGDQVLLVFMGAKIDWQNEFANNGKVQSEDINSVVLVVVGRDNGTGDKYKVVDDLEEMWRKFQVE